MSDLVHIPKLKELREKLEEVLILDESIYGEWQDDIKNIIDEIDFNISVAEME